MNLARACTRKFPHRRDDPLTQKLVKAIPFFAQIVLRTTYYLGKRNREKDSPCDSGGKPRSSRAPCRHSPSLPPSVRDVFLAGLPCQNPDDFRLDGLLDREKSHLQLSNSGSEDW